jgi:hypothetical protein
MLADNDFQQMDLQLPAADYEAIRRSVRRGPGAFGEGADFDEAPFTRAIDYWWVAFLCGAVNARSRPPDEGRTFNTGVVLESWRLELLNMFVLAQLGAENQASAGDRLRLVHSYVFAGSDLLLSSLGNRTQTASWSLHDVVTGLLAVADGGSPGESTVSPT